MFRKITLFYLIILLASCGKDVVVIEDPTPPIEIDETFEVNLVGFSTNVNRSYLPNMNVSIDGKNVQTDESGFFHFEKVLVGRRGKIIQLNNEEYLPTFYRVANHQSLENVMLNLQVIQAPNAVPVDLSGNNIYSGNVKLAIGEDALDSATEFTFKSFVGAVANNGNEDQLYFGERTEFLLKQASFYVNGSKPLKPEAEIKIEMLIEDLNDFDISKSSILKFDELKQRWEQKDIQFEVLNNIVSFPISEYGWWTIAEITPAQYSTLTLINSEERPLKNAETKLSFAEENHGGYTLYTSNTGEISTYFPSDISIMASLNSGQSQSEFSSGFVDGEDTGEIRFDDEIQVPFEGRVYDCEFKFSDGYVAIKSEGQHKLTEIKDGLFDDEIITTNDEVTLQFYSNDFQVLNNKESNSEVLRSGLNNFFSCSELNENLSVSDETSQLYDYDNCVVKIRPKETVVIGENGIEDTFLVSYEGTEEGIYNGLFYNDDILKDVKAEVVVNIVLYDEVENKIGGFIKTEYISSGEELTISFIGNIE